jgi:hypothetical protein
VRGRFSAYPAQLGQEFGQAQPFAGMVRTGDFTYDINAYSATNDVNNWAGGPGHWQRGDFQRGYTPIIRPNLDPLWMYDPTDPTHVQGTNATGNMGSFRGQRKFR